ncbi:MAG: hypothetical protein V1771_02985 [Chloroflexota bacterium]
MPEEVKSAQKATEIATSFLKKYYSFLRPVSATRENSKWVVKVDVGLVVTQIAEVNINVSTADIISYSFPK